MSCIVLAKHISAPVTYRRKGITWLLTYCVPLCVRILPKYFELQIGTFFSRFDSTPPDCQFDCYFNASSGFFQEIIQDYDKLQTVGDLNIMANENGDCMHSNKVLKAIGGRLFSLVDNVQSCSIEDVILQIQALPRIKT